MTKTPRKTSRKTAAENSTPKTASQVGTARGGKTMVSSTLKIAGLDKDSRGRNILAGAVLGEDTAKASQKTTWDSSNGKFLQSARDASSVNASKHKAAGMGDLMGTYSLFGLDPERDAYDALDLMAQHIIDMLISNVYTFSNLTRVEKNLIYRYFYKTNPVIGRIVDLHTDLPLSKTRLQAPGDLPAIAKDYIMQFYERVLERLNFPQFLRDIVLMHCIYGEATAMVDDYYLNFARKLQSLDKLSETVLAVDPKDQAWMEQIETKYDKDPKTIGLSDRRKYIKTKFASFFEPDYAGPDQLIAIPFFRIQEQLENSDIDYFAVRYQFSEALTKLLEMDSSPEFLQEVGYSEGMAQLINDDEYAQDHSVWVENDPHSGIPFVFRLQRPEGSSIIQRVLNEALEWEAAKRAKRYRLESIGKVGRIVTAEGLSDAQMGYLHSEVQQMLDDPGYAIVANFAITWEEVNAQMRDQLDQIVAATDDITATIALGAGMPISLIAGDSQYAGSSIKLEILNVEYHSFKQRIQSLIENYLFKPIAERKGFVTMDDWGNPQIVYPKLTFSRVSLRDESVFDILFSLYQKGSLPVSVILDILNLDPDDVKRGLKEDLFTVNDPNFNELIRGLYGVVQEDLYHATNIIPQIIEELGLKQVDLDGDGKGDLKDVMLESRTDEEDASGGEGGDSNPPEDKEDPRDTAPGFGDVKDPYTEKNPALEPPKEGGDPEPANFDYTETKPQKAARKAWRARQPKSI